MSIVAYYKGTIVGDRRVITNEDHGAFPEIASTAPKVFKSECGKFVMGVVGSTVTPSDASLLFTSATTLFESILNLTDRTKWPLPVRLLCMLSNRSIVIANGVSTLVLNTHDACTEANFDKMTVVHVPGDASVFLGTGDAIANYAFASGKTLEESVDIAIALEPLCGGGVDTLWIDSEPKPKTKAKRTGGVS